MIPGDHGMPPVRDAVRLAFATLAHARAHPVTLEASPFAVLADVLTQPPWDMDWLTAMQFVADAMQPERSADA